MHCGIDVGRTLSHVDASKGRRVTRHRPWSGCVTPWDWYDVWTWKVYRQDDVWTSSVSLKDPFQSVNFQLDRPVLSVTAVQTKRRARPAFLHSVTLCPSSSVRRDPSTRVAVSDSSSALAPHVTTFHVSTPEPHVAAPAAAMLSVDCLDDAPAPPLQQRRPKS